MGLIWQCEICGWFTGGTAGGSGRVMTHQRLAKSRGEKHLVRLVNAETGAIPRDESGNPIRSLTKARRLGLIPSEAKGEVREQTRPTLAFKFQATMYPDSSMRFEWSPVATPVDMVAFLSGVAASISGLLHAEVEDSVRK